MRLVLCDCNKEGCTDQASILFINTKSRPQIRRLIILNMQSHLRPHKCEGQFWPTLGSSIWETFLRSKFSEWALRINLESCECKQTIPCQILYSKLYKTIKTSIQGHFNKTLVPNLRFHFNQNQPNSLKRVQKTQELNQGSPYLTIEILELIK